MSPERSVHDGHRKPKSRQPRSPAKDTLPVQLTSKEITTAKIEELEQFRNLVLPTSPTEQPRKISTRSDAR